MREVLIFVTFLLMLGFAVDSLIRRFHELSRHKARLWRRDGYPDGRLCIYIQPRDLWVGSYLDRNYLYVCPLPTVVFRWQWQPLEPDPLDGAMCSVWLHGRWRDLTMHMTTEQREAAVAAVLRYRHTVDPVEDRIGRASLAWWD
jgi:hypothetical protein